LITGSAPKLTFVSFGQLLRQYRRAAGFSQEHLADLARLSVESIGSLERGARRAPYRETVALLAEALGLDEDDRKRLEKAAERARARGPRNAPIDNSAEARSHLPIQTTPLIGRHQEVAAVIERLQTSRLVTITGSGGVGKTRVAVEGGARLLSDGGTDIRFVDLSQLSDGKLAADTIASALNLTGTKNVGNESRVIALYAIALLAALRRQEPRAARLLGALDAYPAKLAAEVDFGGPIHRRSHALLVELLENSLGSEARERFAAEGRWMSIDMAVAEASLV
jgi:transcriptional regulator with XRE-family HTH domain